MVHEEQAAREVQVYDTHLIKWVWQFVKPYQHLFWLSALLMPLNSAFALAQPYIVKLTIDIFLAHRKVTPPRWLTPLIASVAPNHGLFVMGALYLVLVLGEFATFYGAVLHDHDGGAVQPFRFAPGLVSPRRTASDGVFRSHANRKARQPHQHRHRCDQRHVRVRIAHHLYRFPDPRRHRRDHVHAQSAPCAVGFSVDSAAVLIINFFRVRARIVYREIRDRLAAVNAYLSESINGMAVIQLFTREDVSAREFDVLNVKSRDVQMLANVYEAGLFSSVESLSAITVAVILWFGGGDVIQHAITIGTLFAFIDYTQRFFGPLREISNKYTTLQSALAAVDKIERLDARARHHRKSGAAEERSRT